MFNVMVTCSTNVSGVNSRVSSFANRCIDAWNNLSDGVVCAPFVLVFKYRLKSFLLTNDCTTCTKF